jgi:hypothetical protein
MMRDLAGGRLEDANALSQRLTAAVDAVFGIVASVPDGNSFANANKAMDHFLAYGPRAETTRPPRLHAGSRLSVEVIRATGEVLSRFGLMPAKGYLE